jgi:hypothetical protein
MQPFVDGLDPVSLLVVMWWGTPTRIVAAAVVSVVSAAADEVGGGRERRACGVITLAPAPPTLGGTSLVSTTNPKTWCGAGLSSFHGRWPTP